MSRHAAPPRTTLRLALKVLVEVFTGLPLRDGRRVAP